MGPLTREAMKGFNEEGRELVSEAMHILVPIDMAMTIHEHAAQVPPDTPFEGRLPWDRVVVEIEGFAAFLIGPNLFDRPYDSYPKDESTPENAFDKLLRERHNEVIHIHCVKDTPGPEGSIFRTHTSFLCGFLPGESGLIYSKHDEHISEGKDRSRETIATVLDLLFSFMAEPRFVHQVSASPMKKKASNKFLTKRGMPAMKGTWVKLGWTLGKATRAKGDPNAEGGPKKAFHMVRAHWRRSHYDHETPKAVRRAHRNGWWMWIEAQYRGHPALGVVHHSYQPKLDDPGVSSQMVHKVMAAKQAG